MSESTYIDVGDRVVVTERVTEGAHLRPPIDGAAGQHGVVESNDGWGLCRVLLDSGQRITAWNGIDLEREPSPVSGHADTIRYAIFHSRSRAVGAGLDAHPTNCRGCLAEAALRELEAELVRQADRIAWLEGEVAGWRIKLAETIEDAERYRDALEKVAETDGGEWFARSVARAALDGTRIKLAECEERREQHK